MAVNKAKHVVIILFISFISFAAYAQRVVPPVRQFYKRQPTIDEQGNYHQPTFNRGFRMKNPGYRMQNPGMRKIQVVKENFLSKQLALTPEQGEKFWPVYREYQNELFEVRRLKRLNNSDAQANGIEQIKKNTDYDIQIANIQKRYTDEFLKILPPEKVSELYKSEREFNDELIRQVRENKNVTTPE